MQKDNKTDISKEDNIDNCVFIGKKQTMSYVFAVSTQAQTQVQINVKARGRNISKAVDVVQIILHRFLSGWSLSDVKIGTEEKQFKSDEKDPKQENNKEEKLDRVSFIDIKIIKKLTESEK